MTTSIHEESLEAMRARGGTWAAYRNEALDSATAGHLQFLRYGEGYAHSTPPQTFPFDTAAGTGWKYQLLGTVDLEAGIVVEKESARDLP